MSRDRSSNNRPWPPPGNKANFDAYTLLMRGDLSYNADKRGIIASIRKRRTSGTPPSNTVAPAISGTPTVGQTLSTTDGTWAGDTPITYTYQWLRNGSPITGATASTYVLTAADAGALISCRVTATNAAGSAFANSNQLGPVSGGGVIVEAWIEAAYPNSNDSSGWVLAVRGNWPASTFASFDLDPNGTPRLVVNVANRAGYERSSGTAVSTTRTKQIVVTTPLRRAYPDSTQTIGQPGAVLDETLNVDSTRTVRFALAEPVYPSETLTLTALADWRTTLPAETIAVTNNSTRPLLKPWARWAVVHDEVIDGVNYTPEIVCVSHTPRHDGSSLHQPVAGVRFVASDGTNTVSAWALETAESTRFGDSLWCHRADMNLSALSSGRITIHAEVYPWEGAVWTTRDGYWNLDHITENFQATGRGWEIMHDPRPEKPMTIILDKAGTFLPRLHVVVDPSGTTDPTPANWDAVRSTYEDADTVPTANKPATIGLALDMLAHRQRTVAAANGYIARTNQRFPGGATVWVPAGTHVIGTRSGTSFSANSTTAYGFQVVRAAPGVPRADAIISQTTALTLNTRCARLAIRGVTINKAVSTPLLNGGTIRYLWVDNAVTTGVAGSIRDTNPSQIFGNATEQDDSNAFTNCQWNMGGWNNGNNGLMRNVVVGGSIATIRPSAVFNVTRTPASTASVLDFRWDGAIALNVAAMQVSGPGRMFTSTWAVPGTPTAPATRRRVALVNLLFELAANPGQTGAQVGELGYNQLQDSIFDGVTMVGARFDFHNDPTSAESNYHFEVTRLGCIFDRNATKHDVSSNQPLHTGGWEISYGVRQRDMLSADRYNFVIDASQPHDFVGLNVVKGALTSGFTTDLGYVEDRSGESHDTTLRSTGNGDYRVTSSSFAFNLRLQPCNYPTYVNNVARPSGTHHAGAYPAL